MEESMPKNILSHASAAIVLMLGQNAIANSGLLFNVATSGTPGEVSIKLCLNGKSPASCQNYHVNALDLSISPIVPNHLYRSIGIKVITPGYTIDRLGLDCLDFSNGYCLFSASKVAAKSISIIHANPSPLPPKFSVGGTISGLDTGETVTLLNTDGSTTSNQNGAYSFNTTFPNGSAYAVTVNPQPADKFCLCKTVLAP